MKLIEVMSVFGTKAGGGKNVSAGKELKARSNPGNYCMHYRAAS